MTLKEKINKFLELPEEIVYDVPKITLVGNFLLIENYKNLMTYTKDTISIITNIGILKVEGKDFEIKSISKEEIAVNGTIMKVEFL
ncbi:MAG: sporulation protein YqfC [Clostridiales bacterium]|nr:sporulation protein YqfC [Clostridiales bacterium]